MTIKSPRISAAAAPMIVLLGTILVFAVLNPVGYIGGGQDDGRYLTAARCWVQNGACIPTNHWQGRWPIFAPIAAFTKLLGESRLSVELWPIVCSLTAAWLLVKITGDIFGPRIAVLVGLLFVATPAFSLQLLTPSVEAIELALILAAVLCLLRWKENPAAIWIFVGGLLFGLAFQVRETSIAAAGLAAAALMVFGGKPRPTDIAVGAAGFFLPLAIEFLVYHQLTGDYLYRRQLSLAHARIPSSELSRAADSSRSPILNPDIIAGWRREPGIHIHWLVDGPLNLIVNGKAGFSLLLTPLLLVVGRGELPRRLQRTAWILLGFAAAYICAINYFFAMDPKPRVMLTALAVSSLAFALVLAGLWVSGRALLAAICVACSVLAGAFTVWGYLRPSWAERQAQDWAARYPQSIETDPTTKLMLTLNPEIRTLPGFQSNKPYALTISASDCREWIARSRLEPGSIEIAGAKRLSTMPDINGSGAWICLFRYMRPVPPAQMHEAYLRAWNRSRRIGS